MRGRGCILLLSGGSPALTLLPPGCIGLVADAGTQHSLTGSSDCLEQRARGSWAVFQAAATPFARHQQPRHGTRAAIVAPART